MELQIGENRVGISFESLMWFLALTAVGTVIGGIAYDYLLPYLPAALQPAAGSNTGTPGQTPTTTPNPWG